MAIKYCPNCDTNYPESCFYKSRSRKDGRRPYCKACEADLLRDWKVRTGKLKSDGTRRQYRTRED